MWRASVLQNRVTIGLGFTKGCWPVDTMVTHLHGLHERPVHNTSPLPAPFVQDDSSGIFCCKHLIIRDSIADGDGSIIIVSIDLFRQRSPSVGIVRNQGIGSILWTSYLLMLGNAEVLRKD